MTRRISLSALVLISALTTGVAAQSSNLAMNGVVAETSDYDSNVRFLLPADLDGDGLTDLIGSLNTWATIWRQVEGGRLTPLFLSSPKVAGRVVVADLDGDGTLSLVG